MSIRLCMLYYVCDKMKIRSGVNFGNDYGIDMARFQLGFVSRSRQIGKHQMNVPLRSNLLEQDRSLEH